MTTVLINQPSVSENSTQPPAFVWKDENALFNICEIDEDAETRAKAVAIAIAAPVSVVLIILLSFLHKRRFLWPNILNRRPGIMYPVNMLETQQLRFSYVAAFCITALQVYDMLLGMDPLQYVIGERTPDYLSPFVKLLSCLIIGLIYYPIFAALSSKHWLGYIIGGLYSISHFVIQIKYSMPCWNGNPKVAAIRSFQILPIYVCYIYLIIMFIYRTTTNFRLRNTPPKKSQMKRQLRHFNYVKQLLSSPQPEPHNHVENKVGSSTVRVRLLALFHKHIYKSDPNFRFSLTILVSSALSIMTAHILAISILKGWFFSARYITHFTDVLIRNASDSADYFQAAGMFGAMLLIGNDPMTTLHTVVFWVKTAEYCFYVALTLSFVLICSSTFITLKNYKHQLLDVFKGKIKLKTYGGPPGTLTTMCKYVGYQIGYTTWGFVIELLVSFIILFTIVAFLIWFIKYDRWDILFALFKNYGLVFLFVLGIHQLQKRLVHVAFLQRTSTKKVILALDNRRAFFAFQFFMVFINAALGFVSCLMRLLKGLIFGVWIVPRLDVSTMPQLFQNFDAGNKSYISLLDVENHQSNPVLCAFVQILYDNVEQKLLTGAKSTRISVEGKNNDTLLVATNSSDLEEQRSLQSKRNQTRWMVAYTLLSNPSLYLDRKKQLRLQIKQERENLLDENPELESVLEKYDTQNV